MKPTYFSDPEYRLLLSALNRERKICEVVNKECKGKNDLILMMNNIQRKIQDIQYGKVRK